MAKHETDITHKCMIAASKLGVVLFKNVRGMFLTQDATRKIRAGLLADGSSDLIGWKRVTITPDMIGKTLAVFTAIEIKTATGRASPEQKHFIEAVQKSGGIAAIVRDEKQLKSALD